MRPPHYVSQRLRTVYSLSCRSAAKLANAQQQSPSDTISMFFDKSYGAHPEQTIDLYRPHAGRAAPLIILVTGQHFCLTNARLAQQQAIDLTHHGFAVAVLNFRQAPEFTYLDQLKDLSIALLWLEKKSMDYGIDFDIAYFMSENSGANLLLNYINAYNNEYLQQALGLNSLLPQHKIGPCVLINGCYQLNSTDDDQPHLWRQAVKFALLTEDIHAQIALASPLEHVKHNNLPPNCRIQLVWSALHPWHQQSKALWQLLKHSSQHPRRHQQLILNERRKKNISWSKDLYLQTRLASNHYLPSFMHKATNKPAQWSKIQQSAIQFYQQPNQSQIIQLLPTVATIDPQTSNLSRRREI